MPKPSGIVARAPADTPDRRAVEAIEDEMDAELAAERLHSLDAVPWDEAKKELGIG